MNDGLNLSDDEEFIEGWNDDNFSGADEDDGVAWVGDDKDFEDCIKDATDHEAKKECLALQPSQGGRRKRRSRKSRRKSRKKSRKSRKKRRKSRKKRRKSRRKRKTKRRRRKRR